MDESDDSDDEFDGYLECEEMEKLLGECKTDESDDEECVPIECNVNECVNEMEFAVRHELDKMDVDGCDEVECKNDVDNEVPDEMYVDEHDDSAVSAVSIAGAPSTVPSALLPTISSTTSDDTSTGKCKIDMSNKSPIDFFKMLVTLDILDNIVDQTNLYAIFHSHLIRISSTPPRAQLHHLIYCISELHSLSTLSLPLIISTLHCTFNNLYTPSVTIESVHIIDLYIRSDLLEEDSVLSPFDDLVLPIPSTSVSPEFYCNHVIGIMESMDITSNIE